jgi:hypothetical protein
MKGRPCDLQSIYSSARKLPSAARTIDRIMSGPLCVRFPMYLPTWYSTMASLRSSARSHTAAMSPSFSTPSTVAGRSDRSCNLFSISSRALRSVQRGYLFAVDGNTYSYKHFRRVSSSACLATSPSTPSRSNRARTDSTLSLAGDAWKRVTWLHLSRARSLTRCSFRSVSKDALNRSPAQLRNRIRRTETHGQMDDLVVYGLLLRHLSHLSTISKTDDLWY